MKPAKTVVDIARIWAIEDPRRCERDARLQRMSKPVNSSVDQSGIIGFREMQNPSSRPLDSTHKPTCATCLFQCKPAQVFCSRKILATKTLARRATSERNRRRQGLEPYSVRCIRLEVFADATLVPVVADAVYPVQTIVPWL